MVENILTREEKNRLKAKKWYLANKEKHIARCLQRHYDNREERLVQAKQYYRQSDPARRLYQSAKTRARLRGLDFTIQVEDVTIPTHCPYLGCELTNLGGRAKQQTAMSLDRIDSSKGYIPGNVQVISLLANMMKQNATPEQLLAFAEGVKRIYG